MSYIFSSLLAFFAGNSKKDEVLRMGFKTHKINHLKSFFVTVSLFVSTFVFAQPSNDNCSGAILLNCGTTGLAGSTVGAVLETAPGSFFAGPSGLGVWYTFIGDGTPTVISSIGTGGFDHEMSILSGDCSSLTGVISLDNGAGNGTESHSFTSTVGVVYYVYIAYFSSTNTTTTGTFTVSLSCTGVPCSGAPNAGTAAISSSTGCTGQSFTLSATGITAGSGMSYQWQTATTASGPWTNVSGATSVSSTSSVASAGTTYYQLVSTCTNGGATATSNVVSYTASSCGIVPTSGVSYITATCGMSIYDSGGPSGNYTIGENGILVIRPPSMNDILTITGTGVLRNAHYLYIDEGEDSNPNYYIQSYNTNSINVNYTASGPGIPISLNLYTPTGNTNPGFALTVTCTCAKPTAITMTTVDAPCGGTGSVTVTSATPTRFEPWVMTTNENNTLPALSWLPTAPATNAWISGSANMQAANNNQVELTSATNSLNGALVYESFGQNRSIIDVWFDLYAGGGGSADGAAFSYGPGIANTSPTGSNYETGVGTGLWLSFDSYNSGAAFPNCNGTNWRNIYLIYNSTVVACYTTYDYTGWRTYQSMVNLYVSSTGLAYVDVYINGTLTTIFNGVQLPPGYVSANKSTWRAAFTARTGGVNDQHRIDNVNIYHNTELEYSINNITWQTSPTFSGLTSGNYTMYVRYKGNTSCSYSQPFTITAPIASTAPTSITGTNNICTGSSTTLTTAGGTLGTEAEDVWYSGACPTECYKQEWLTQPFASFANMTVNSITNGVLNVTSTNNDPMIDMSGLGSFDPTSCRYVNIRYRVTSATPASNVEIFFYNTANPAATATQTGFGSLISDNTWRTVSVDMWADIDYQTGGNITGWRFDWATAAGVTMDIDFIMLSNSPIIGTGTSITVSPTVNTTYYTLKQGPCNTTSCESQLVSITQPPTTATVGADQTICGLTTAALGGNTPAIGTGTWAIVSGGTGTFSNASSPSSTFTASTSGVYVLSWTITNAPCTASSANVTVTLYANPTTATVGANQTICSTLTSNALGGNTPTVGTGAWSIVSGGTGTFSDAASPSSTFTATATGTYVLRWTITNGTCPVSTADITVLFAVTPTAGITGTTTFCSGSNTTLTASGGATYAWADGSGTSFGTNAISNTITAAGTYTVTVTSASGCTATASQVISVTPNVTPTFTQIQAQCQNTAAPVLPTSSTNSPAITGTWSPLTISTTTVGTATYTFTPTAGICATTATMSISVVSCAQIAPCDILVYRIESGAATATNSAPISLLEFDPSFTNASSPALVNAPTTNGNLLTQEAGNTANSPLTGYMNTYNGVTAIPGYRDAAGTSVTASDNEGTNIINANQSTTLFNHSVFTGGSSFYRAVVPVDGTRFYALGIGSTAATSGIFYYNGTSMVTIFTDAQALSSPIRNIEIFNGQLYCSRKPTAVNTPYIYAVGTGLPETTATLTGVANASNASSLPNDFSISPDGSTMYVADVFSITNGITKFYKTLNGNSFVKVSTTPTFNIGNSSSASAKTYLGLAVDWLSTPVKLYATASISSSNTGGTFLNAFTESAGIGVNSATWPAVAAVQYYNSTNNSCTSCKYAGVDLAPTIATSVSSNGGCIGNPITVTASALQAGVGTLTYKWYKYTSSAVYVDYFGATLVTEGTDGTGSTTATFTPLLAGNYFCEISGTCAKFRTQRLVVTSPPVVGTITPNACSGSTATVPITASGALPGYDVSWTGTATGNPVGTEIATSGGSYTTPALGSGTYTFTVTASNGCATIAPAVTIACGCTAPAAPTATVTQPTCAVSTGTITVTAPANGATITYTVTGTSPVVAAVTNATGVFSGLASGTYDVTATDATCVSTATPYTINIAPVVPSAPVIGTITQPTCAISTGSVDLSGLPASGTWTVTGSPSGSLTGTGTTGTITGLTAGTTYTFTVLNADGCTSSASSNAVINGIPSAPSAPVIGTITQPTCAVATGSVALSGLPSSGTWTVTGSPSGSLTGTGATGTVTGLTAGTTYTFTVTDANGCTSSASSNAILTVQPSGPSAPVIGTITQATCTVATGTVDLSGLPASGTWTVTGSPSGSLTGTGTTGTVTGLTAGTTYTFTVTDANGCTSSASTNAILTAQPSAPTAPVIGTITQATCAVSTGSVDLSGLPSSGTWTVTGSPSGSLTGTGTTGTVTGLTAGTTYTFTVTDASGCTSIASSNAILIAQPTTPTAPTIGTITQATCTVSTGSVDLSGLPSSGTWTVTGSPSGSLTGTGTTGTVTGLTAGTTYTFTVTNASGCTSSASANAILTAQPSGPSAPIIGTITQATCAVATGSVDLSGLPSSGTWTVTGSPSGSLTGTGTTGTVTGLTAGTTYTFTVTDANGCTSSASASAILTAQPSGPSAPVIGTITQATCAVATGSVDLSGLPSSGTWTVTGSPSGSLTGTGTTGTVTGLTAGTTYTFTVTDANGCTSSASANAVLIAQPTTPSAPVIGTITQPTCTVATGSVALSGLPSSGTWTVTGSPSGSLTGTGTTGTVTGLTAGTTYTFTVTNASGCTSSASANAILTVQPSGPGAPIIGAITQPTCSVATGSVDFSGLPSSGTWTVTGTPSGSLTGTGTTGTISGLTDGITYTFTVTDASGCISVASSNAVINAQPPVPSPVTLDLIQPTCTDLGVIKVLIPAVGPGITFTVTGTNPVVTAVTSSNAIFSDITPGVYSVSASNGTCSTTAVTCTINPQPSTPTISGTASTCINSTTQLTGSPTAAASSPWTSSNTGVATVSNTGLVTGVDAGTTTITYTNTDGCSATVTVTISDILDWANLQSPGSGTICVGGTFDIYGQLYNTGTVNTTINASAATGVTVEFGYNSSNTNPNTWTNWSSATFNPSGGGTNNDEYMGTFTGLPAGTYYYAFRYQINGCGWQYGGYSNGGGGFWNGTSYVSGVLTVNTAPTILFISPP